MDKTRTLGEELAFLRRRKGWTQTELAKRVGLSVASIGFYEQGRMKPTPRNLIKLAQVLDVDPEYLFNIAEKDEKKGKDIKQVRPEWVDPIKFLDNEKSFGRILSLLRKQKGLKQSELADRISVTRSLISNYENDKIIPKPETIKKIAEVLGVDFIWLLKKAEECKNMSSNIISGQILHRYLKDFLFEMLKSKSSSLEEIAEISDVVTIPVLGHVHAGDPNISDAEIVDVLRLPRKIARKADYALVVKGMSMREEGILPGDIILIKMQNDADNGQIVIVRINDKFFLKQSHKIEPPSEIVGRVVFLLKEFK